MEVDNKSNVAIFKKLNLKYKFLKIIIRKNKNNKFDNTVINQHINNPRKFGMSEFHSSFSYQRSVHNYSIPKTLRFKKVIGGSETGLLIRDENSMSKRSTSIGYGKKISFESTRIVPGPNVYNIKSIFELRKDKGITISKKLTNV